MNADNLTLEVNSSRHAYAVTPCQVIQAVYGSVMTIAASQGGSEDGPAKLLNNVKKCLKEFMPLLSKYVKSWQVKTCYTMLSKLKWFVLRMLKSCSGKINAAFSTSCGNTL